MPIYQVTTKYRKSVNGIRIEPGLSVQVVTNGGQAVIDAFYRIYGIDIKKDRVCFANLLSN